MSKLNVRLTYRVVSKTKFGAQSVINSITSSAVSKPRLSKQLKPSNVAIIMPPNSIVQDMAGALKLCGEQGDKKSLYVFWQNLVSLSDATAYHARPLPPKPKSKKVVAQPFCGSDKAAVAAAGSDEDMGSEMGGGSSSDRGEGEEDEGEE